MKTRHLGSCVAGLACALTVITAGPALAQSVSGFGTHVVTRLYPHSGVPLLDSFYLRFTSSDRHLLQIGVEPEQPYAGGIRIAFNDDTFDDEFYYTVSSHSVQNSQIQTYQANDICVGSCTRQITRPQGNYIFVLRGFRIYFHGSDHHIKEISIRESNGYLTVRFNDKNEDDTFLWNVDYAYVPASQIQRVGTSSGTRAQGGARAYIDSGNSVIRGFRFKFQPYFTSGSDHHINEVGVMTPSGRVDVYFSDKNRDDGFDWNVDWAIVSPYVPVLKVNGIASGQ